MSIFEFDFPRYLLRSRHWLKWRLLFFMHLIPAATAIAFVGHIVKLQMLLLNIAPGIVSEQIPLSVEAGSRRVAVHGAKRPKIRNCPVIGFVQFLHIADDGGIAHGAEFFDILRG